MKKGLESNVCAYLCGAILVLSGRYIWQSGIAESSAMKICSKLAFCEPNSGMALFLKFSSLITYIIVITLALFVVLYVYRILRGYEDSTADIEAVIQGKKRLHELKDPEVFCDVAFESIAKLIEKGDWAQARSLYQILYEYNPDSEYVKELIKKYPDL